MYCYCFWSSNCPKFDSIRASQANSCVLLTCPYWSFCTYLHFGTKRHYRLILCFHCPRPGISNFSKETWFLLGGNVICSNQDLGSYAHCYWGFTVSRPCLWKGWHAVFVCVRIYLKSWFHVDNLQFKHIITRFFLIFPYFTFVFFFYHSENPGPQIHQYITLLCNKEKTVS